MKKYISVDINVTRIFLIDDDELFALKKDGVIPDIVNQQAPNAIKGWTIDKLTITDKEGQLLP